MNEENKNLCQQSDEVKEEPKVYKVGPGDPIPKDEMPQKEPPEPGESFPGEKMVSAINALSAEDDDEKNARDYLALAALPYIELYTRRSGIMSDLKDLQYSKEMMDSVDNIFKEPNREAKAIAMANQMDTTKIRKTADEFYRDYPALLHEAQRILDLMDSMLESFPEGYRHSTSFISRSMVESANMRRDAMARAETKAPNHDMVMKRLTVVTSAYEDRTNFTAIFQKLQYPHNIRKLYKEFMEIGPDKAMVELDKIMMPVFADQHMTKFRKQFTTYIAEDPVSPNRPMVMIFFITFWLAKVYEQEFTSGKCAFVKSLVMDVYDVASGMYDCIYGDKYIQSVCQTIYVLISFAATANLSKKQLSEKYQRLYDTMMEMLASNKQGEATCPELPERTSLMGMYPDLDYAKFRAEREIIEGDDDTSAEEGTCEDAPASTTTE